MFVDDCAQRRHEGNGPCGPCRSTKSSKTSWMFPWVRWFVPKPTILLLMEEILHHLGWLKPYKYWNKVPINWCRISSIHSTMAIFLVNIKKSPEMFDNYHHPHEKSLKIPTKTTWRLQHDHIGNFVRGSVMEIWYSHEMRYDNINVKLIAIIVIIMIISWLASGLEHVLFFHNHHPNWLHQYFSQG